MRCESQIILQCRRQKKKKEREAAIEKQENPNYEVPKFLNTYRESMCSSVAYGKSITSLNFKTKTW